jgi:hypothetical protein
MNKLCCVVNCAAECPYCGWKRCKLDMAPFAAYGAHFKESLTCPKRTEVNTSELCLLIIYDESLKRFYGSI